VKLEVEKALKNDKSLPIRLKSWNCL